MEGLTAAERTLMVDWDTEAEGRAWPSGSGHITPHPMPAPHL